MDISQKEFLYLVQMEKAMKCQVIVFGHDPYEWICGHKAFAIANKDLPGTYGLCCIHFLTSWIHSHRRFSAKPLFTKVKL